MSMRGRNRAFSGLYAANEKNDWSAKKASNGEITQVVDIRVHDGLNIQDVLNRCVLPKLIYVGTRMIQSLGVQ